MKNDGIQQLCHYRIPSVRNIDNSGIRKTKTCKAREQKERKKIAGKFLKKKQKWLICKDPHTMFNCERSLKKKMIHSNLSNFAR